MIRKALHAAALTAVAMCASNIGCSSSDSAPFKGGDGSAAGGSSGAAGQGGSTAGATSAGGNSSPDGAAGGSTSGQCGGVFGHADACKSCLVTNCCDLGTACGGIAECAQLADCTRGCDSKSGAEGDTCRTNCNNQFLTASSRPVYNGLVTCMGNSCLSQCPFHGP